MFCLQDFQKHPLYRYWHFEHGQDDPDKTTFGFVRYLNTDIRLRIPKELRGFEMSGPWLFHTTFINGCIKIPMQHLFKENAEEVAQLPEAPLCMDSVPSKLPETKTETTTKPQEKDAPKTPKKRTQRSDPKTPGSSRSSKSAKTDAVSPPPSSAKSSRSKQ